jgi:hypothetical protein
VGDLVEDGVADLLGRIEKRERSREGDLPSLRPARTEATAGVVEGERPAVEAVPPHEGDRELPGVGEVHAAPVCAEAAGDANAWVASDSDKAG